MSKKHKAIKFSSYSSMLERLRDKGLSIDNPALDIELLKARGYYNLVNRYKEHFQSEKDGLFPPHTHLTDLYYYHRVEDDLINILFKFTISFEQRFKEAMAFILARDFGLTLEEYLDPLKFRNRNKRQKITQFILKQVKECSDNPTAYYKKEYQQVPPWIMLSNLTLGQTRMLFSIFRMKQTKYVVGELLPIHSDLYSWRSLEPETFVKESLSFQELREINNDDEFDNIIDKRGQALIELTRNMITVIKDFRNTLAHGNRLIGFRSRQQLNFHFLKIFVSSKTVSDKEFYSQQLGKNDLFACMISLVLLMDKFDSMYFLDQLEAWEKSNSSTLESKNAFNKFIKSCNLPIDFVARLRAIPIELSQKQKDEQLRRWQES